MNFPLGQLKKLNVTLTRLVTDSRAIVAGDTFVAYPGEYQDGRRFIADAIERGANAVIWEAHDFVWDASWQLPNLAVGDLRHKAGWLADEVYGNPSQQLRVIGITGTNGKTSISHWVAQVLSEAGQRCAMIGTLGNGFAGALQASANTTPDAIRVHGLFVDFVRDGAQAVAMEVSSHALAQGRVNGVNFDIAVLSNLSRDHLDYHGDMDHYAACKRRLFDWEKLGYAVLNLDDPFGAQVAETLVEKSVEVVGYGMSDSALALAERLGIRMVYGNLLEIDGNGLKLDVHSSWGGAQIESALIGRFNAANLLATLAAVLLGGVPLDEASRLLGNVVAVNGRMQRLGSNGKPVVVVDYAHTPDALENVLLTLREISDASDGRLVCVFGCGGDRDKGKRAMMGRIAERFADHCIITDDNPRSEDSQQIIGDIVGGMTQGNHEIVSDRSEAIRRAVAQAGAFDTVLIAGKGHEDYQEIAGVRHAFSDVDEATRALRAWRELA